MLWRVTGIKEFHYEIQFRLIKSKLYFISNLVTILQRNFIKIVIKT